MPRLECWVDGTRLGVSLGTHEAWESVTCLAADAGATDAEVDCHAVRAGVHAQMSEPLRQVGHVRLMGHGRVGKGRAAPRLGGVIAGHAVDAVDTFRLGVVRLDVSVRERPRGRRTVKVLQDSEVRLSQPWQARSIYLAVAADHVMHTRTE